MHFINTPREIRNNTRVIKEDTKRIKEILENISNTSSAGQAVFEGSNYGIYQRMGFELLLDSSSIVDRSLIEHGSWEPEQIEFITKIINKLEKNENLYFLDIGAYWGLYSMVAARLGVTNVIAFEADRYNFSQFMAQQFLNNTMDRVHCRNLAVSDNDGTVLFHDSRDHPDGNRGGVGVAGQESDVWSTYEVERVTIDRHVGLSDKTIVAKIDVEGHEQNVLAGMKKTILENDVVLQIEIFPEQEATVKALLGSGPINRLDAELLS